MGKNQLTVVTWNANGVLDSKEELEVLLHWMVVKYIILIHPNNRASKTSNATATAQQSGSGGIVGQPA